MLRIFFLALTCISSPIRAYYIDPATGYPVTSPRNPVAQGAQKQSFASIFQEAQISESPIDENGPALITSETTIPFDMLPTTDYLSDAQIAGLAIGGAVAAGAIATKAVVAARKHRKKNRKQNRLQQEPQTPAVEQRPTKKQSAVSEGEARPIPNDPPGAGHTSTQEEPPAPAMPTSKPIEDGHETSAQEKSQPLSKNARKNLYKEKSGRFAPGPHTARPAKA